MLTGPGMQRRVMDWIRQTADSSAANTLYLIDLELIRFGAQVSHDK